MSQVKQYVLRENEFEILSDGRWRCLRILTKHGNRQCNTVNLDGSVSCAGCGARLPSGFSYLHDDKDSLT